jgi:hypothetical protein
VKDIDFYAGRQWGDKKVPRFNDRFWILRVWRQRVKDAWLVLIGRESIGGW